MNTDPAAVHNRHRVPRHRLTVSEYHRLGAAGTLGEADRVELPDGQPVDMSPVGPRHALAEDALTELLVMSVQPPGVLEVETLPGVAILVASLFA